MEETYTIPELARRLRLNPYTIRRYVHRGLLEAEIIEQGKRKRYLIKKSSVDALNGASEYTQPGTIKERAG